MRLKKLEIQGFKTFVEPVSFNFDYPIVAIVGPNGSGKSNIVDAVKWCMGEQSAKQLRANEMVDLIFNGSEHRKSVGMAEVSLVFSNNGINTSPSYESFSEIVITRRMYRGEESEYYLNKDPKRLKDILEFLLDIGISSKAFSIIEQGQIGEIIDAKPETRRYVIEDAAGILKYKNRKKIALDKIELTKANIARISDLLAEIKRQLNQVNKQVKIAQDYKALKEEYKNLDLGLLKTEYTRLIAQLDEKKHHLETTRFELAKLMSQVSARYTDYDRFKKRLEDQGKNITEKQSSINNLTAEAMVLQEKIESLKKLKETLQQENERVKNNQEELTTEQSNLSQRLQLLEKRLEEEKGRLDTILQTQKLYEQERNELTEQINEVKDKIEDERNNEFNRVKRITEFENQIISAEHDLEHLSNRLERIQHDRSIVEQKIESLKSEKQQLQNQEQTIKNELAKLEEHTSLLEDKLRLANQKLEDLLSTMEQSKKRHEGIRSRYDTLDDLRKNMDGYTDGTRYILQQLSEFNIDKVIADYLDVQTGYELAVQSVLGDIVQAMVVSDYGSAEELINALRRNNKGRAIFVIKNAFKPVQIQTSVEGGTLLINVIKVKDQELLPVFQSLFNNVYVVNALKDAYEVSEKGGVAVTVTGDIVKSGLVYGGSEGSIKGGIIERRKELDALKKELDDIAETITKYEENRAGLLDEINEYRSQLMQQEDAMDKLEKQQSNIGARILSIDEQLSNYETNLLSLNIEEQEIRKNSSELLEEISDLKQKKAIHEEDKGTRADVLDALKNTLLELESMLEEKKNSIAETNVNIAAFKERINAQNTEIKRIKEELDNIHKRLAFLQQQAINNSKRIETIDYDVLTASGKLAGINQDIQQKKDAIIDAQAAYDKEFKEYAELESEIKRMEKEIDALKERESSLAIEVSELTMKSDYIKNTAKDKYSVELDQYNCELINEEDVKTVEDKLSALSEKIAKMGDVNVGAISEYEELQKRVEFYEKHKQDLEQAIEDLKKVINSINRESRKLFREVFDKVNENFKKVIPKLFDGGRGELILTDEQDLLESGMEIVIQPLGKRLQNINLLSGGEKALAAIGLLISIFMVKPSPFALLDEIDAPLDDASVGKLNNIIKELSDKSQFILITHNKKTIEIADAIYGITMEEPGVSKIISVKLQKETV
ncbi:MAG: chromosome segregation protein SMC [bacterium]